MRFDHQQFQRTLTVCLALAFATIAKGNHFISLMPNDPEGLVGRDMHLWCSVSDGRILLDANFTIVYRNRKKHHMLPANDSVQVNATTVMLTISNLTDAYDMAMVFCRAERETEFQVIRVGRAPPMPDIFYYRYLNWENFVFAWKINPKYNGFKTKYTAWFKSSSDVDFTPCDVLKCEPVKMSSCIAQNENNCTVPKLFLKTALYDGFIYFKVNGTNKAGNVTSEIVTKQLQLIVEPGPVKDLRFQIINASDRVSYLLPDTLRHLNVQFHVVSKENSTDEDKWIKSNSRKKLQNETLLNLKPHTAYQLSARVECAPSPFRSKWTNVTFISHEEAPSQAPEVCGSCFERESNSLTVHFQPLTREQSRGNVSYNTRLLSLSNGSSVLEQEIRLRYSKGAAVFKLSNVSVNVAYQLNISASTSSGSSRSTYIDIPTMSEVLSYPTNCTVMSVGDDAEQVVFRWNNSDSSSQRLKNYTMFWCNGSMNRMICDDPLKWLEVDAKESSASVKLNGGHSGYMFGIAVTTANSKSSGIQWSCSFYNVHSVGLPPYIHPGRIDETAIEIHLAMPPYNPKKGFIYGYNLYYAELDDKMEFKKVYLDDRATRGIAVVDGLSSGRSYLFKAESLTLAGPSNVNITIKLATKSFSLSSRVIGCIVASFVLLFLFAIFGCIYCLRCPLRFRKWIKQVKLCMPEVVTGRSDFNEQDPTVPSDYCVVVEISSKDDHRLNRQNDEEEEDTVSNYSAVKSNHECISLSRSKMTNSSDGFSYKEPHQETSLPHLKDCTTELNSSSRLKVFSSFLSGHCDMPSDVDSDYLTSSHTASSYDGKERACLIPENSLINTTYAGRGVSRVVEEDPDEMYIRFPSASEQRHEEPLLLTATRNTIDWSAISANGRGLDVSESVFSVLPHMSTVTSSVLPSVHAADERTKNSENKNILPKIGTNFVVGVPGCCEVSSGSENGSSGTEDRTLSTGMRSVDPSSFRSSLSRYSSSDDGTESSYADSGDRMDVTPASNPDDQGVYL